VSGVQDSAEFLVAVNKRIGLIQEQGWATGFHRPVNCGARNVGCAQRPQGHPPQDGLEPAFSASFFWGRYGQKRQGIDPV
jgi:hypothetical protein